jgi:hypothetical protein
MVYPKSQRPVRHDLLSVLFGHPRAAAGATIALAPPNTPTMVLVEKTGAVSPLVAGPNCDLHTPS